MGCRIVLDGAAGFVEIGLGRRVEELLGAVPLNLSIITNQQCIITTLLQDFGNVRVCT